MNGLVTARSALLQQLFKLWSTVTHKPQNEKSSVVILPPDRCDEWLQAGAGASGDFLRAWPAERMPADAAQQGLSL
ncbi:hypothetical protein B9Z38_16340 [Limnohabitans sp. MMS-10A-160]|nr:hypothetical protein B9Z43_04820 [Limnohabitans sp. MMS-10A-192]PUE22575.1 hypothetical protein B9Z38_16340 [Limnohabitans sp. MMS-10A-160]